MAYPAPEADRDAFRTEQPAPAAVLPEAAPIITKDKSKDEYMKEITDRLEAGVRGIMSSDNYKSYLASMSKFHSYSFRNTMLIFMQKPDASLVSEDEPGNGSVPYILSQTTGTTLDSRWLYSSNYLRIKNLTLGYKLPINPKFISYARVYLSIENLAKWDSYYGGYSPEAANVGSGPGGASALGLDYGGYPNARTFTFGINVNF